MRRYVLFGFTSIVIMALLTLEIWAAGQARIRGTVLDADGKPVPGAKIVISCKGVADFVREIKVKDNGTFTALILDATKKYTMTAQAEGYEPDVRNKVKVGIGSTDTKLDFKLFTQDQLIQSGQQKVVTLPGFKEFDEGNKLLEEGKKTEAIAKFEAAVAAKADLIQAWEKLAVLNLEAGNAEKALAQAQTCLALDEEDLRCLAIAINASHKSGDTAANKKYLAIYAELNPEDPAIVLQEAAKFINAYDDKNARPLLEKCLELDPEYPECLFQYGNLLLRAGDSEGAKANLQKYLEVDPEGVNAPVAKDIISYL